MSESLGGGGGNCPPPPPPSVHGPTVSIPKSQGCLHANYMPCWGSTWSIPEDLIMKVIMKVIARVGHLIT